MKMFACICLVACGTGLLGAEEAPLPVDPAREGVEISAERVHRYVEFQTGVMNRIFGVNVSYSGVLPMIRKAEHPLQLINPFAPEDYGVGYDNVSRDPHTAEAKGLYLFVVKF